MLPDHQTNELPAAVDDAVLLKRICEFVADAADCSPEQVGADDDIYQALHVDSLGAMAIFIDISYEFRVPEPDSDTEFAALNTPTKLLAYVRARSSFTPEPTLQTIAQRIPTDLSALSPYGDAFRFIESVLLYDSNRVVTEMTWRLENPLIMAHFRAGPHVVPGTLLSEQVAQSALLLARLEGILAPGEHLMLTQLRSEFRAPAEAPVATQAEVRFRATVRGHFGFGGFCRIGETEVARVKGIASRALGYE
ncbi:MAG: hypothetical protein LAO78_06545 [Acidobacteriia bacterium]|nr:hypothetical protein [Terriglobia bacterium]